MQWKYFIDAQKPSQGDKKQQRFHIKCECVGFPQDPLLDPVQSCTSLSGPMPWVLEDTILLILWIELSILRLKPSLQSFHGGLVFLTYSFKTEALDS